MPRAGPAREKATRGDLHAATAEASRPRGPARPGWGRRPTVNRRTGFTSPEPRTGGPNTYFYLNEGFCQLLEELELFTSLNYSS
ncbi:MAG: hypothetical protein LBT98_01245 [Puniceicoccales bacterium]|nr:hypothetical protein [Puniceicoccales bacterium]